jgi:hypothetical protein
LLDEATAEQIRAEAGELMRTGIVEAEAEPPGDVSLLFEYAYAEPLPSFEDDLRELRGE